MQILTVNRYLKEKFDTKVYKLSLSAGTTCPNRDGKLSTGGCYFCSAGGSGEFAASSKDLKSQITEAKLKVDSKFPKSYKNQDKKYIAYFQSFTNTYGNQEKLKAIFKEAISYPEVVILSIATRADCLTKEMILFLAELNKIKPVWIEIGLQTIHQKTHENLNTKFSIKTFEETYAKLKQNGISVIVHVILGLPGESKNQMKETIKYLAKLNPVLDGIKIQVLNVLKGTKLAEIYQKKPFKIFEMQEYCDFVVECLKLLPPQVVVHRLTGDGPKQLLLAPKWIANKRQVLNAMAATLTRTTATSITQPSF